MFNKKFLFGLGLFLLGGFLIIVSQPEFTGNVIAENNPEIGFFFGLVFFIAGVLLMEFGAVRPLEREVVRTPRFEKAIKRQPPKIIDDALAKIGSGAGREEMLRTHSLSGSRLYAIRAGKGNRVLYERHHDPSGKERIVLIDYTPDHDYGEFR